MKLDKVFVAFDKKTKKDKERLLYKQDKNTYLDLFSNETIKSNDINIEIIIPFLINNKINKHTLKFILKNKYKKDREKLIKTKKVLLGIGKTIIDVNKDVDYETFNFIGKYTYKKRFRLYTKLPLDSSRVECYTNEEIYKIEPNIENNGLYLMFIENLKTGDKVVDLKSITLFDIINENETYVEKKELREFSYIISKKKTLKN